MAPAGFERRPATDRRRDRSQQQGRTRTCDDVRSEVVVVTTSGAEHAGRRRGSIPIDELARRKGVRPIESPDEMARDVFESDEELEEFLAFIAGARHADLA